MKCRHCNQPLQLEFIDLGSAPPSNAYLTERDLRSPESWFPLRVLTCENCWLVQTEDYAGREALFTSDYAYFSSFSQSWLAHSKAYAESVISRFELGEESCVVEVAANDGYLLQYFAAAGIPNYGIEPTASTAAAARKKGIEIVESFFGVALAGDLVGKGQSADIIAANNVLAHVPDINDFVSAFALLLKPEGVATFEFPHLLRMAEHRQFDTVYHEHYSYLSLNAVTNVFEKNGLQIFDVEEITTHGGSLRVFAQRTDGTHARTSAVARILAEEDRSGIKTSQFYLDFQAAAEKIKNDFVAFLIDARREGKIVAAYGAAAKGNTMMNYAGVRPDLISYVVDRNPAKAGKFMPGSRLPIVDETELKRTKPDYIVFFPWNLKPELEELLEYTREWGAKFVVAVPALTIF